MHVLVLSPHRDDAAFSCGLLSAGLLRDGARLTIANVCTVSDYAPYLPTNGTERTAQVTQERAAEDGRYFTALTSYAEVGPQVLRSVDLDWLDAPLRLSIPDERVLTTDPHEEEVTKLAATFADLPSTDVVLAPLAVGGHIDHRLVREAAFLAFPKKIGLYEDLPYAACMSPEARDAGTEVAGLRQWVSRRTQAAGVKRQFAMHYPSQIAMELADEMDAYAVQHGGKERFYVCEAAGSILKGFEGGAR